MFRIPPPDIGRHLAEHHRLDLQESAEERSARSFRNLGSFRALGAKRRALIAVVVLLVGLTIPWTPTQLAGAAPPGATITCGKGTPPIRIPAEGRTGIVGPTGGALTDPGRCRVRTAASGHAGAITAREPHRVHRYPPEGHTDIVVPSYGAVAARALGSLLGARKH